MSIKGAGILIIENYKNNLVVTLFGNQGKEYSDLGGVMDPGETPIKAACREAREESANLIKIEPDELKNIGNSVTISAYKAYIVYIKNLSIQAYQQNVKKVFQDCNKRVWKENNSMTRIPLDRMIDTVIKNNKQVRDINNNKIKIRGRTIKIIEKAIDILDNIHTQIPHYLHQNVTLDSRMQCLIGTYTYTLKPQDPKTKKALPQKRDHRYAIYVVPNLKDKDKALHKCNQQWGGIHITLVGFSANHPPIKPNLKYLSNVGKTKWRIRGDTIRIRNNAIFFDSNTLDKIAIYLTKNTFQKVKGKRYSGTDWHITMDCAITENMLEILKKVSWTLCVVRDNNNGTYTWMDKYRINKL
jgi:ADP-ribose pyrophosphatase YjhB (NUDIX family)